MITVHHLTIAQSERVLWLLEELGLPYELVRYERDPKTILAPDSLRQLHPMGLAPVITDGAVTLAESGAIVEYILAKYGQGRLTVAPTEPNFGDYLYWFHFANATLMPSERGAILSARFGMPESSPAIATLKARSDRAYSMIEERLARVQYFAGDAFTAADIMMVFPLTTLRVLSRRDISGFANLKAYLKRIGERPAYRRAMANGDPGMTPALE